MSITCLSILDESSLHVAPPGVSFIVFPVREAFFIQIKQSLYMICFPPRSSEKTVFMILLTASCQCTTTDAEVTLTLSGEIKQCFFAELAV